MVRKLAYAVAVSLYLVGGAVCLQGQGFSIPISDKVIKVEITLPDWKGPRDTVHATVRDGTMLTIRNEDHGYVYGFVAYFDKEGQPVLLPFEIQDLEGGGQKLRQAGSLRELSSSSVAEIEFDTLRQKGMKFGFRLEGADAWAFPTIRPLDPRKQRPRPSDLQKIYGKAGGGTCCVSCGSVSVCGTAVDMDCGACDSVGGGGFRVQ